MRLSIIRPLVGGFLLVILAGGFFAAHMGSGDLAGTSEAWLAQLQMLGRGNWGMFLLLQTLVAISGVVPASLVGIAAGAVFGLAFGFELATCSTLTGAVIAFALGRSVFRPWVEGFLSRRPGLQRLDGAVAQDGWRSVTLLRLSPIMPFAITSYALGLTALTWRNYLLGTLASLPSLFCYVAMGHFAGNGLYALHAGTSPLRLAMLLFGVVATGWLILHLGTIARRSLVRDQGV